MPQLSVKRGLIFLMVMAVMVLPVLSESAAKKKKSSQGINITAGVTTVEGIIENIPDDTISVGGKRYKIEGVPVFKPSGEQASREDLRTGTAVRIFFENKVINSIVIYEEVVQ